MDSDNIIYIEIWVIIASIYLVRKVVFCSYEV